MKQNANLIRPGWVIEHNGKKYTVLSYNIVKPGKGGAFINLEMRDIEGGAKIIERMRTDDTVEKLMVEDKKCQYLYPEDDMIVFMDNETFDQFKLPSDTFGDALPFLKDGMQVSVHFIEGKPLSASLPKHVTAKIETTEPTVKGQTATNSFKPATLDNGVRIMVPPFIAQDEEVVVNTEDLTYVERAKK